MGNEDSDFANRALVIKRQPGLYKTIKKIKPEIVITEGFGGWAPAGIRYALFHRKKLCMFYERTAYVERNSPFWRTLYRKIVGIPVNYFLVNGKLTEDYLNDGLNFKHTPKVKWCMCADSYNLARSVSKVTDEDKISLKRNLCLNDGITYLFVGQIVERKGILELLNAWLKHIVKFPNDNLIVIGKGILLDKIIKDFSNESSIHILGAINYDSLFLYYSLCDVFVMPTLEDNWCLVIPEAMACGKPVASSIYNGGHYELVKEGVNGFNFNPLLQTSILEVLEKFHNVDLRLMGHKSVEIESEFTPDKAAKRIFDACEKLSK